MVSQENVARLYGSEVYDRDDHKIGTVGQIYAAEQGAQPTWASVHTGLFGQKESLVPIDQARWQDNHLQVPYEKGQVKDAPRVDASANEPIASHELAGLYEHYHLRPPAAAPEQETARQAAAAPGEEEAVTRSEEQMRVGTERQEVGKARLHKYVVTEHMQTTVPVQHEEVRLEREPITEANRDPGYSPEIKESDREMILHAERPIVAKEAVPVERVRLDKETVSEDETVGGDVRKERVEADIPERR